MAPSSLESNKKNLIQTNLYQVALTIGKIIGIIPFFIVFLVGVVIVSPLWLAKRISLMILTDSNEDSKEIYNNNEQSFSMRAIRQ
ncbi:MAG: hypothetical protein HC820_08445 [Hydrococcus sp. RM1_1_31]|nr:hypothetical protein [Hydrococcus sp. RM1_1_31]